MQSCAASVLLWAITSVGRWTSWTMLAIVNVLPLPVTPFNVWKRSPSTTRSAIPVDQDSDDDADLQAVLEMSRRAFDNEQRRLQQGTRSSTASSSCSCRCAAAALAMAPSTSSSSSSLSDSDEDSEPELIPVNTGVPPPAHPVPLGRVVPRAATPFPRPPLDLKTGRRGAAQRGGGQGAPP